MIALWLVLAFVAGYATRQFITPRVINRYFPPVVKNEYRDAGLRRYQEYKRMKRG